MKAVKEPCPECPFSRNVTPGALGGSKPEAYVGQVVGPFTLPCHMHCDFDDPDWRAKAADTPQCAGAAMLRKAINAQLPKDIPLLDPTQEAFTSLAEFYAHHTGISLAAAKERLTVPAVQRMLIEQLTRAMQGERP